jgi:hypothetical protein
MPQAKKIAVKDRSLDCCGQEEPITRILKVICEPAEMSIYSAIIAL